MQALVFLYLACILAGFALANIPTSAVITAGIANLLTIIGGIVIIIFVLALLFLGVKSFIKK